MKFKLTLSALAAAVALSFNQAAFADVQAGYGIAVVETAQGAVQGYVQDSIITYKGIPYATAERFMPPQKVAKWADTRLAVTYGKVCPQIPFGERSFFFVGNEMPESEDCQNLNVWTPSIDDGKKRAVMVWIHGGGFQSGSSNDLQSYDGENLARSQDVVVVSVNHRLNAMGHLDLSAYGEQYKNSANVGVMDLVASLEWVKDNIAKFGGDPENITIFGESGGGAKVLTLMGTPAAQGLFHKAIVQSGALEKMGMTLTSPEVSRKVAEFTLSNLGISDVAKLAEFSPTQINEAAGKALTQTANELNLLNVYGTANGLSWAPTLDGSYIPKQPVGEQYPAMAKNIPLLIGSNLTEWTSFPLQLDPIKYQNDNRNTWTDEQKQQKLTERFGEKTAEIVEAFKQAYPNRNVADALYVDTFLRTPALKTARLKADQQGAPVYNYLFTWDTPVFNGIPMSYHTAEIAFVFNNIERMKQATGGGEQAKKLAKTMSTAWANFAKTGNPNGNDLPQWDAYNRESGATMIFDNEVKQVKHHDEKLIKLLRPDYAF